MIENKFPFKIYTAEGQGVITSGYHERSMEIIEVLSGNLKIEIGTDSAECSAGNFLYIPSGLVFRAYSDGFARLRSIVFDSSIIENNMENFDNEIFYMFYVQSRSRITVFTKEHPVYETLLYCMSESYDEYAAKDICYKLPIRANIYLMMTELLRYYCGSRDELDRMIFHNVMRLGPVITYIEEHYGEKIYIDTLAEMITVSSDYFTKMFKDSIGKTPVDFINGIRINKALEMLALSDISINDIADKIGFSNPNYFHKIFKQYMDISPLAYRKNFTK